MRPLHKLLMVPILGLGLAAVGLTTASADPSKYDFHAGDGFGPLEEPDVASASDGATITIEATGSFHVTSGKASSTLGTFVHRNADGSTAGSGTFTVTSLQSFAPFGCGVAGGQPVPSNLCGGYAVFSVHVVGHPASGGTEEFNAVLGVDCVLGDHVPPGAKEGIVFDVPGLINFDTPVSGETVFVIK